MNAKKWIITALITSFIILSSVLALNILVDPIWTFNHKNQFNTHQRDFDERLQKSVFIKYRAKMDEIDSLIMGSSRVTYYNQHEFKNMNAFNYAFSSGTPAEFNIFIDYAKNIKKNNFDNIVLGLDFVGLLVEPKSVDSLIQRDLGTIDSIENSSFLRRYLSFNTAVNSMKNIYSSISNKTGHRAYDRNNIVHVDKLQTDLVKRITATASKNIYQGHKLTTGYQHYYDSLVKLKNSNDDSNFIVFTTPVSSVFLDEIKSNKTLTNAYFEWIEQTVNIFDEVYFFTYRNHFSENYKSLSKDGDHYYPDVVSVISNIVTSDIQAEPYGLLINKQNLNEKLEYIKNNLINKGDT